MNEARLSKSGFKIKGGGLSTNIQDTGRGGVGAGGGGGYSGNDQQFYQSEKITPVPVSGGAQKPQNNGFQ